MCVEVSVYWTLCVSLHVIPVMSKSQSKVLACLSYILFLTYCACDEVNYFGGGACGVYVYRVYFLCYRTLNGGSGYKEGAY